MKYNIPNEMYVVESEYKTENGNKSTSKLYLLEYSYFPPLVISIHSTLYTFD